MGTMINGKKWLGACINGEEVNGLVKNGIVFYCKLNKDFLSSLQIFCKTAGDIGEDRSFCKNGDVLRLFLGTNTLLDHTNYPILNIGGTTKSFNYSYEYLGNYYYGVDINVVEAMNLINDEPVPFSITNIFLANGEQVSNLNNSDITATDVTNVIYDNIAPLVSGVTDEEIYANQSVFPSVTDSHLKSVTLNGESFVSGTEISTPGTYNLIATDKARNITDITFELVTGDITPPVITSLGILNSSNYGNQEAQHYATIGDDVRVLIYFAEMLEVEPTVKMGSKEFTATYREQSSSVGSYAYYADCILSTDMNLPQGEIQIEVYGYADAAGNVGETLTNEDIDNSNYDYVIFDSIAPEYYSLEILNATRYAQGLNANYAGKNDTIRVSVSFPEQLTVSPQLKIGDKVIEGGLVLNQTKSRTTNLYYYSNNVEITDDMNLVDGDPIPIQVYGYEDIAGNVGETLTNIDIKNTEYTEVIYDISAPQTGISGFPLFILASRSSGDNRPYTVIRNGENLFIEVNFNEQLVHNPKISLIRKDGTKTDAIEIPYINMIGKRYRYYINITINNSDLGLSEGDQIGFEVTDVEDFAGNTATFDNDDVTSIKLDDGREYGQVTYDNTPPTITVKTDATATVGSIENKVFSKVSFSISDGVGLREWQLNNAASQQVTVSKWGDINNVTIDTAGAVEGTNTLKVRDTAGNEATYEFILEQQTSGFTPDFVSCVALNPEDNQTATVGTTIWVYVRLPNDLTALPKVKINGKDANVFINQTGQGTITYVGSIVVTEDMEDGPVSFVVYDYVSADGTVGEIVTTTTNDTLVTINKTT